MIRKMSDDDLVALRTALERARRLGAEWDASTEADGVEDRERRHARYLDAFDSYEFMVAVFGESLITEAEDARATRDRVAVGLALLDGLSHEETLTATLVSGEQPIAATPLRLMRNLHLVRDAIRGGAKVVKSGGR